MTEPHQSEIVNKRTGEIIDVSSRFLVVQFTKTGLPIFLANKSKTSKWFTKNVDDSLQFYSKDYAVSAMKKLKYGQLKVISMLEALQLEKEGEPAPYIGPGLRMKEY